MKRILITAILLATYSHAVEVLNCRLAEVSIYSTTQKNTAKMTSKRDYIIEDHRDYLIVNGKRYELYKDNDGVKSYLRGKILFFKDEEGRYYIRRIDKDYTGWLICK